MNDSDSILKIRDLSVAYRQGEGWLEAVRGISISLRAGETYGLVGESGSGKTTLILAIMRYLGEYGVVSSGRIELDGNDLLHLSEAEMREVWGQKIALVPQNPQSSLNPSIRIGEQLAEILRQHQSLSHIEAKQEVLDLFKKVNLPDPAHVADSYPHQISGGMQQRVLIAMALSIKPVLLVLDEPTSSLDVTTQAVILDLVRELIRGGRTAVLYVTHNLGVVALICDRVGVLYAGELIEEASTIDLFHKPLHPYTQGLLDSVPRLGETKEKVQLRAIQGQIPSLGERPAGCVFEPRCPIAIDLCKQRPPWNYPLSQRRVRCHRWDEIYRDEIDAEQPYIQVAKSDIRMQSEASSTLSLENLQVFFLARRSLEEVLRRVPAKVVRAVDGINLKVKHGKTLGLVGESGSGKTTLSRAIVGLVERTGGSIQFLDLPLPAGLKDRDLNTLRQLQMVFQNPEEALNPYLTVGETLKRTVKTLLGLSDEEAGQVSSQLLEAVQLPASYGIRFPEQLSGGEKQRVAIARAFTSNPSLLICDEPVSSLDVSVQASILNLLNYLQAEHGSSQLFISHDLAVVGYLADQVAVIYLGQIMEVANTEDLFEPPYNPYTEALLSAIPLADPQAEQKGIRLEGEIPSPTDVPTGCPFHTRCPRLLGEKCTLETPTWQVVQGSTKLYFCHIQPDELLAVQKRAFSFEKLNSK